MRFQPYGRRRKSLTAALLLERRRHNLIFTKSPVNAADYKPVSQWCLSDFLSYLQSSVIPKATVSLAFFALSLCILFGFLLW